MLIAISARSANARSTGSLSAGAPGGIVIEAAPPNVSLRRLAPSIAASGPASASGRRAYHERRCAQLIGEADAHLLAADADAQLLPQGLVDERRRCGCRAERHETERTRTPRGDPVGAYVAGFPAAQLPRNGSAKQSSVSQRAGPREMFMVYLGACASDGRQLPPAHRLFSSHTYSSRPSSPSPGEASIRSPARKAG